MKDTEPSAVDGGYGWLVLLASFINQVLLLGYVKAAGVLFVEWQEFFNIGSKEVGWAGIILAFFGPMAGLVSGALTSRFGSRPVAVIGGLLCAAAIAATSFVTRLWHIYILSSVSAIGLGFNFQASITVVSFYFKKRIGIANGVAFSGVGGGILVVPPLLQYLCTKYEWTGALLIMAAIFLTTVLLSMTFRPTEREQYFILKSSEERQRHSDGDEGGSCLSSFCNHLGIDLIWRYPRFGLLVLSYALAGFGYYASVVFFSSRAVHDANIPKQDAAYLISAIGLGSTVGRAGHGFLIHTKCIGIFQLYIICGFLSALSSFLNPVSNTWMTLFICALSFGLFSGTMLAVSLMCARQYIPGASVSRSFGVLILSNGIGIMFGTFAMGYLNDVTGNYALSFISAGIGFTVASIIPLLNSVYDFYKNPTQESVDTKEPVKDDVEGAVFLNGKNTETGNAESLPEEEKKCMMKPETSV